MKFFKIIMFRYIYFSLFTFILVLTSCADTSKNASGVSKWLPFGTKISKESKTTTDDDTIQRTSIDIQSIVGKEFEPARFNKNDFIRIGMLLPLSGNSAKIGVSLRNAALMAQYEVSASDVVLQFYDTKDTPEAAAEAASEAILHGARLLIGPVFATSVPAVAEKAKRAGVNVITFSNNPSVISDGVFSIGLMISEQVNRIITYAFDKGYSRFALLAPDNEMGSRVLATVGSTTSSLGASLVKVGFYDPMQSDFSKTVKDVADYDLRKSKLDEKNVLLEKNNQPKENELEDVEFDAILIADEGVRLRSIAAMLPYYDIYPSKVKFLGTSTWNDPQIRREAALLGGWHTILPKAMNEAFQRRYYEQFEERPHNIASLAYDAVALAVAISKVNKSSAFSLNELTSRGGFSGVDGIFRLLPDGYNERGLAIVEITKNGQLQEIESAPETFNQMDYRRSSDRLRSLPSSTTDDSWKNFID